MVRVRSPAGKVMEVDTSYRFVEICDALGKVARVLYTDDHGVLHDISTNSPEAKRYQHAFKVEFISVKHLPE